MRGLRLSILGAVTLLSVSAWAASSVVIEDWSSQPLGAHGVPAGWEKQQWGTPTYDFTIVESGGRGRRGFGGLLDGSPGCGGHGGPGGPGGDWRAGSRACL